MDQQTTPHRHSTKDTSGDDASAFHTSWQPSDAATLLQPSNMALPKITRAWERKPLSPFSRSRVRVGKVWKRPAAVSRSLRYAIGDEVLEGRDAKRQRRRSSGQEFRKPVKKMCLDSGFGLAPSVVGWEACESPGRKIVTRSTAAGQDIIALEEDKETRNLDEVMVNEVDAPDVDVTIEILDEDGNVLNVDAEDAVRDIAWQDDDEDSDIEDENLVNDEVVEVEPETATTSLHQDSFAKTEESGLIEAMAHEQPHLTSTDYLENQAIKDSNEDVVTPMSQMQQLQPLVTHELVLPEGFVSPVKRRVAKVGRRKSLGSRRRTLPVQFAPTPMEQPVEPPMTQPICEQSDPANDIGIEQTVPSPELASKDHLELEDHSQPTPPATASEEEIQAQTDDQVWEDVETSDSEDGVMDAEDIEDALPIPVEYEGYEAEVIADTTAVDIHTMKSPLHRVASAKLPSSPIPSIEGQHPRLPLRRSPRRKSSSPLKQSTILPPAERSHLIAFTPLKAAPLLVQHSFQHPPQDVDDSEEIDQGPPSPLERVIPAPQEETRIPEREASKPRVSEDTAFIQAFLSRAAESRAPMRTSTTSKRESVSNRRDSDAIRQALASPAKPAEVLAELDPNSPSPHKAVATPLSNVFDDVIENAAKIADDALNAGDGDDDNVSARRSGRTARKPIHSTYAPLKTANKISIRGPNGDGVVLKRSEAQELALLTRNNTRKNKGGAVLPPLRLTKIAMGFGQLPNGVMPKPEADDEAVEQQKEKDWCQKGVRWAETLVEFSQTPNVEASESSVLSEESTAPAEVDGDRIPPTTASLDATTTFMSTAPPPAETPSKPKIRKLKAQRTAAAPGKPSATPPPPAADVQVTAPDNSATTPAPSKTTAQSQTKRRSRIATPAKGLTSASLLPTMDLDPQPVVPAHPETKAGALPPQKKRKAPVSKLPAPSSTTAAAPTSSSSILGQGKENNNTMSSSFLLSPPKKKTAPTNATFQSKSALVSAPKLDFGGKAKFEPNTSVGGDDDVTVPGLSSPAKKGGRTRMVSGMGARGGDDNFEPGRSAGEAKILGSSLGMSSPAKKRTRRAV